MKFSPLAISQLAISVSLALGVSGCRLGNRIERPQSPYSETALRTDIVEARACVALANETDPRCANIDVRLVPDLFREVLKSPVWLWNDSSQGVWLLYQKSDTSKYLQVDVDPKTDEISFQGASSPSPLWEVDTDPCLEKLELIETGRVARNGSQVIDGVETVGTLDLNASWYRLYEGKCEASLKDVAACLTSVSNCRQSTAEMNTKAQQAMNYRFAAFIESGLIAVDDLKDVEGTAIWVHSK